MAATKLSEEQQKDEITANIGTFTVFLMDSSREIVPDIPKEAEVGVTFVDMPRGDMVVKIRIAVLYRGKRYEERNKAILFWREAASSWDRVSKAVADTVSAINRRIVADLPDVALKAALDKIR